MPETVQGVTAGIPGAESPENAMKDAMSKAQELGRDDFLKLLVTKLSTPQDPMSPMEDADFIAQLASFSHLSNSTEQIKILEAMSEKLDMLISNSGECECNVTEEAVRKESQDKKQVATVA